MTATVSVSFDRRGAAAVFVAALAVYAASMCREVYWGDSAELVLRAVDWDPSPAARGYPLHGALVRMLSWITRDAAVAGNLLSVLSGAAAAALVFEIGRRLGGSRAAGAASSAAFALGHTTWYYAGVAEVYALHSVFLAATILLALAAPQGSARTRFALGAVSGLALLHHRMIAFAWPGVALHLFLSFRALDPAVRARHVRDVALGFAAGALPFLLLCAAASRTPPAGETSPLLWWIRDVFLGGDHNTSFVLGAGRKSAATNAAYVARWVAFCLPGAALALAAWGGWSLVRARAAGAALLLAMVPFHLWFPLRYDWTGDQFAFLAPLYVVLAALAGVGTGRAAARFGARWGTAAAAACALFPPVLYAAIGLTPLGDAFLPGRTPEQRAAVALPWHGGERPASGRCRDLLARVPPGAVLHCDWGDGQVYRYLQRVEGLNPSVTVRIWYGRMNPLGPPAVEWVSVLPWGRDPLPRAVAPHADRLEDRGGGLFGLRAERK